MSRQEAEGFRHRAPDNWISDGLGQGYPLARLTNLWKKRAFVIECGTMEVQLLPGLKLGPEIRKKRAGGPKVGL